MRRENTRNKGFSLVELIVVVAITAVLAGSLVTLVGLLPRKQVMSCARNVISQVENARMSAMSFQDASVTLYKTTEGVYAQIKVKKNGIWSSTVTQIGNADLEIAYLLDAGGEYEMLGLASADEADRTNKLEICFAGSSGGFRETIMNGNTTGKVCSAIRVSKGSYSSELKLVKVTGKITNETTAK